MPRSSVVAVSCLALIACLAASAFAQNWAFTVNYSDKDCTKWGTYSAIRINNGCAQLSSKTSIKVDCASLKTQICQDTTCSTDCKDDNSVETSNFKECTAISNGIYSKSFCGVLSSPFPGETQVQVRQHYQGLANPNNTCTVPMTAITGLQVEQCTLIPNPQPGPTFGKVSCKDNKVSAVSCTDNTCTSCQAIELPDCFGGIKVACGVGSVSGDDETSVSPVLTNPLSPSGQPGAGTFLSVALLVFSAIVSIAIVL